MGISRVEKEHVKKEPSLCHAIGTIRKKTTLR